MSTDSHDKKLLAELLAPLVSAVDARRIDGVCAALAVLRAGVVLLRVGAWMLLREGATESQLDAEVGRQSNDVEHDVQVIVEMAITKDIGTPFPLLGG